MIGFLSKLNPFRKRKSNDFNVETALAIAKRLMHGTYDAARGGDLDAYWANADAFDADSAHSKTVRATLVKRSRYELANNGYSDGIAQTYATDLVGVGPQLRMQTSSTGFNQLVEREWYQWCKAVQFRRKLWCMAHAKHADGEAIAVLRINKRVAHTIPLDLVLYETEQCQTPLLQFGESGHIDGIKFDEFGNPLWYDILTRHPGSNQTVDISLTPERVPADRVVHWFKMRRPGQHRGIPECASTLNLGAAFRRLREANLCTAEKVAAWTLFLKTIFQPEELQGVAPLSTFDVVQGMLTALPNNMEPFQLKAEHPGPSYDSFHKTLLNEQARPKNMPFNKAACNSSDYNYASGRLDHQTYYGSLDVDREDGNDLVLDRIFPLWFDMAIFRFGWLGGNPDSVGTGARAHLWDWPKHRVADVEAEANANQTKLKSGQIGLHQLYTDGGMDLDDEIPKMAVTFGVDEAEIRKRLLDVILPAPKQPEPPAAPGKPNPVAQTALAVLDRVNGNGVHHAN